MKRFALSGATAALALGMLTATADPQTNSDTDDVDLTPKTCGAHSVSWHIGHSARNARRAWDPVTKRNDERFLKARPHTRRHREIARWHRECVEYTPTDLRMAGYWRKRHRRFEAFYEGLLSPPGRGWLAAVAACESGSTGDLWAVNPNGHYGRYQMG